MHNISILPLKKAFLSLEKAVDRSNQNIEDLVMLTMNLKLLRYLKKSPNSFYILKSLLIIWMLK